MSEEPGRNRPTAVSDPRSASALTWAHHLLTECGLPAAPRAAAATAARPARTGGSGPAAPAAEEAAERAVRGAGEAAAERAVRGAGEAAAERAVRGAGEAAAGSVAGRTGAAVAWGAGWGAGGRWAGSGGMALTGWAEGPALDSPVDLAVAADGAALALAALAARRGRVVRVPGADLLGERAALLRLTRNGTSSPGGSTRLLRANDAWVAIGLRRAEDVDLVPALIQGDLADPGDPWPELTAWVAGRTAAHAVDRAQLLGLPAGTPPPLPRGETHPWRLTPLGPGSHRRRHRPLVVDFSALWAGPLATSLLLDAGADVIKIESPDRPDGGRAGSPAFFDLLNAGKINVAARPDSDLARRLVERADLVVTSARPRALEHLGLTPRPGRNWLTITGHGYVGDRRDWVAYGDDAAVAGGLLAGPADAPVFCADAVADPLTGLHAAVAALAVLQAYEEGADPVHVDISLTGLTMHLVDRLPAVPHHASAGVKIAAPHARPPRGVAPALGSGNEHPLVTGRTGDE